MKSLAKFLATLLQEYQGDVPGASIGIIENNELILTKSYGVANIITHEPCSEKTNFRLCSVTKQFTATCILQLIDQQKIRLDDNIIDYFPEFIHAPQVTIFHLLTHSSGLGDFYTLMHPEQKAPISDQEVLQLLAEQQHNHFAPGSSWEYNDGGYCILKELIEKIAGISYAQYLKKHIFYPLGMDTSLLSERNQTIIPHRALGYSYQGNNIQETDNNMTSLTMGDGSIYSSVIDVAKWIVGRKKLISKELFDLSHQKHFQTDNNKRYGFGLRIKQLYGNNVICHGGSSIGFRVGIYTIPAKQIGIIVLTNCQKRSGTDIAEDIATFLLNI